MKPEVELVATGSELLNGRTVNRHASVLGEQLKPLGLPIVCETTVPDDIAAIEDAIRNALRRVDMVLVTGGLGPTCDDVTRDAIARMLGRKIVMDEPSRNSLRTRYGRIGRAVTPQAELQAQIVEGATALANSVGMAPGERLDLDGKVLFALPGPPDEFRAVLLEHVLPWLRQSFGAVHLPAEQIFMVCGIGESDIMRRLDEIGFAPKGVEVAYCAAPGRIEVRLTSPRGDREAVESAARDVRQALGESVFAEDRLNMEEVVGRLLAGKKSTLATAESCTGGLVGHRITMVSGSSDYYLGGVIAYSNAVKERELGVNPATLATHGAVSAEAAREMAEGVRTRFSADFGLSLTGIAGPTGGMAEKPVGLVFIALADRARTWVRRHQFNGDRARIKDWSSQMALDLLRRRLQGILKDE
jgi:nicotinamide-nucleotide amidase